MGDTQCTPASTAPAVLTLSKAAWRLGISLSKLDHDTKPVATALSDLTGEIKSLSTECDLIYAKLEEIASRSNCDSPPPYDGDGRMWFCLATQVEETSRTIQELESFVKSVSMQEEERLGAGCRPQRLVELNKSKDQIETMGRDVHRHTDNLRTTLLLIQTVLAHLAPHRAKQPLYVEVEKLQRMVKKLQRSSQIGPQWRHSHTEATLMQYAQEALVKGTTMQAVNVAMEPVGRISRGANSNAALKWLDTLETIRYNLSAIAPSIDEAANAILRNSTPSIDDMQEREGSDSDDDLDTDFAKAALNTGTEAFDKQEWEEANSLLQEGLRILQPLSKRQRAFCDVFVLHYKLAVCAYHTQEPADAEEALNSLLRQSISSDEQRQCIHNATHLLSQLYIRMGQVDRARVECEKALQARRRLLGKQHDASLESMALMAHIYVLLNNRALAKSCLAMIPAARREPILRKVENCLGVDVEHLDFSSLLSRATPADTNVAAEGSRSRLSTSDAGSVMAKSPAATSWVTPPSVASEDMDLEDLQSFLKKSPPTAGGATERRPPTKEQGTQRHYSDRSQTDDAVSSPNEPPRAAEAPRGKTLTRKEILSKVGCQPRDRTEEAVCEGDHSALLTILNKKKGFWRSSVRKRGRPERVTALHFAALFGEVDMARRLLDANFNINEVPFGYSTSLTPLNFAIGARQVAMVDFLTANGAKPSEPDTWSTLAGQLMSRSWLLKTMSESERDVVPNRIIAIMDILLRHGWDINAPMATSGSTVLHQAVNFWTGAYKWDLSLRSVVTSYLCERGADPFQENDESKTPYAMAKASGHQDLVLVLEHCLKRKELGDTSVMPVELSAEGQ
ncbi:ankyrin [Decorospora gaudefroyi]|uniref:Ankyrin n=1 Tax=Decorospora gaudefroyi TaxID=184978 RepID=A0A6A5KQV4_9PLEO|nr:ankyrin [Decorospora gaudefroyi]